MRAWSFGAAAIAVGIAFAGPALADTAGVPAAPAAPAPAATAPRGLAVVATDGLADAAWPLAQEAYGRASLRPAGLDEVRARVLAGDPPREGSPQSVRDLAETRGAIRGDDAPSRQLLASTARELHVRALVVVLRDATAHVTARVFLADTGAFDAATYTPDAPAAPLAPAIDAGTGTATGAGSGSGAGAGAGDGGAVDGGPGAPGDLAPMRSPAVTWHAAVDSLERAYGAGGAPAGLATAQGAPAPKVVTSEGKHSRPFYASAWFWGALGAAAFGVVAVVVATRDNSSGTIHLQMQVPK